MSIAIDRLRELFLYDPEAGVMSRKFRPKAVGWVENTGYMRVKIDGRAYQYHVIAWAIYHGAFPDGEIDHINHIRTDNRICNLRSVSKIENCRNQSRSNKRASSGHVGVYKCKNGWQAQIRVNGNLKHLGRYEKLPDAVAARENAAKLYGFHQMHGRPLVPESSKVAQ